MQKYDPLTMTFDTLFDLHSKGERVSCPVCGSALHIEQTDMRRIVFCETDRRHFFIMPSTIKDRIEVDALIPPRKQSIKGAEQEKEQPEN